MQIISTLKPDYFQTEIHKAMQGRKEKDALAHGRYIEMEQNMLTLISNSMHVSRGQLIAGTNPLIQRHAEKHLAYLMSILRSEQEIRRILLQTTVLLTEGHHHSNKMQTHRRHHNQTSDFNFQTQTKDVMLMAQMNFHVFDTGIPRSCRVLKRDLFMILKSQFIKDCLQLCIHFFLLLISQFSILMDYSRQSLNPYIMKFQI